MKEQARARYQGVYTKAGLDANKILEDDPQEVCKLAVWSYEQFEMRINTMNHSEDDELLSDNSEGSEVEQSGEMTPAVSDNKGVQMRKLEPRNPDEIVNLPVFGYDVKTEVDEHGVIKDIPVIQSQASSLRACDTCFVASNCPAFKPQSVCAFNLPVEVKTKEQLKSLINAIIEMQGQRVIDRLFKLIKTTKELDDSREFIRMTVERQGSAGVLSSIFGERAQVLNELPAGGLNEEQTTRIIKDLTEEK